MMGMGAMERVRGSFSKRWGQSKSEGEEEGRGIFFGWRGRD